MSVASGGGRGRWPRAGRWGAGGGGDFNDCAAAAAAAAALTLRARLSVDLGPRRRPKAQRVYDDGVSRSARVAFGADSA